MSEDIDTSMPLIIRTSVFDDEQAPLSDLLAGDLGPPLVAGEVLRAWG